MKKKNAKNNKSKVEPKINSNNKKLQIKASINLDSESDIEDIDNQKIIAPKKEKNNKNKKEKKGKNNKVIGKKHKSFLEPDLSQSINEENIIEIKKPKDLEDDSIKSQKILSNLSSNNSDMNCPSPILNDNNNNSSNKNIPKIKKNMNKKIIEEKEDQDVVVFPYEYTERIIDALSCKKCSGIYIRPYAINIDSCGHVFCLGCIMKILNGKKYGQCIKCKTQFNEKNIRYSETTDFYIRAFFPQIPKLIEENINMLNNFMENEARKIGYTSSGEDEKINVICQLKPFKESIPYQYRLPEIMRKQNNFIVNLESENENFVSILKNQLIKRLNMGNLREDDIELRLQGIEISQFNTFKMLKSFSGLNPSETITFFYNKKGNN